MDVQVLGKVVVVDAAVVLLLLLMMVLVMMFSPAVLDVAGCPVLLLIELAIDVAMGVELGGATLVVDVVMRVE